MRYGSGNRYKTMGNKKAKKKKNLEKAKIAKTSKNFQRKGIKSKTDGEKSRRTR